MNESLKNLQEWEKLYLSTPLKVWGDQPVQFVDYYVEYFKTTLSEESKVLDAGSGEGRNLISLSKLPGKLYAIDGSISALSKIDQDLKETVHITHANLETTPYENETFDLIFGIDIVETLPCIELVLNEFFRILKKGGYLICNIPNEEDQIFGIDMQHHKKVTDAWLYKSKYFYRFFKREEVVELYNKAGFSILESKRFEWQEQAHPNFRSQEHTHVSQVYVAKK